MGDLTLGVGSRGFVALFCFELRRFVTSEDEEVGETFTALAAIAMDARHFHRLGATRAMHRDRGAWLCH